MAETQAASKHALDFTNVTEGSDFSPRQLPAGDYLAKITKVLEQPSKSDNVPMWVFAFQPVDHASAVYPYYCKLAENQLWKIRNLLVAAGINVPKKKVNVDPNKVVGKEVGITLEDDEYEGKLKSVIVTIFPKSEFQGSPSAGDNDEAAAEVGDGDEGDLDLDDL